MNGRCEFREGDRSCGHPEVQHEIDREGRTWCVPCWGSDDDALAYHAFTQLVPA
jgi:hypothetical protein